MDASGAPNSPIYHYEILIWLQYSLTPFKTTPYFSIHLLLPPLFNDRFKSLFLLQNQSIVDGVRQRPLPVKRPDEIQEVIINYFRIFIFIIFLPSFYPLCIHLHSFLPLISVTLKLWKWHLCLCEDSFQHRATTCIGAWNYAFTLKQHENDETHAVINLLYLL
jgi:hypothetical protein